MMADDDNTQSGGIPRWVIYAGVGVASYVAYKTLFKENKFMHSHQYYEFKGDDYTAEYVKGDKHFVTNPWDEISIKQSRRGAASYKPTRIFEMFELSVRNAPNSIFWKKEYLQNGSNTEYEWKSWTRKQIFDLTKQAARAFIACGLKSWEAVSIIGFNSPQWLLADLGAMYAGGITAGVYTTNNPGQCKYIAQHSKSAVVVLENKKQLNKFLEIRSELPNLKAIVIWDIDENDAIIIESNNNKDENVAKLIHWNEFMKLGNDVSNEKELEIEAKKRRDAIKPGQCCTLIYTSGTTGFSKGCMLSHDNVFSMLHCSNDTLQKSGRIHPNHYRNIAYLPLSHMVGQIVSWWGPLYVQSKLGIHSTTYYCRKNWKRTMGLSLKATAPTSFISVPRIYEKFYEGVTAGLAKASIIKKSLFNFVLWIGRDAFYNCCAGGNGKIPYLWPFVSNVLCNKVIKKAMGFQYCNTLVSGGAPLPMKVRETFAALNMPILDGYGMSETSGGFTVSRPNHYVPDACGPVIIGSEILIDQTNGNYIQNEGEICLRGRGVMMGYINEYEKTKKIFDDCGYLHSGDIGYIDKYSCLHITGRIKELIITAGGENIAPIPVENYIKQLIPSLSQAIMIGDKKKYCSMVVSIASEIDKNGNPNSELQPHAKLVNSKINTVEEAQNDPIWHQTLRDALIKYNNNKEICISNACRIQYFQILPSDLSVNNGTLSASLKMKRHKLYDVYKKEIGALYGDNPQIAVHPNKRLQK
eukprot:185057_1